MYIIRFNFILLESLFDELDATASEILKSGDLSLSMAYTISPYNSEGGLSSFSREDSPNGAFPINGFSPVSNISASLLPLAISNYSPTDNLPLVNFTSSPRENGLSPYAQRATHSKSASPDVPIAPSASASRRLPPPPPPRVSSVNRPSDNGSTEAANQSSNAPSAAKQQKLSLVAPRVLSTFSPNSNPYSERPESGSDPCLSDARPPTLTTASASISTAVSTMGEPVATANGSAQSSAANFKVRNPAGQQNAAAANSSRSPATAAGIFHVLTCDFFF